MNTKEIIFIVIFMKFSQPLIAIPINDQNVNQNIVITNEQNNESLCEKIVGGKDTAEGFGQWMVSIRNNSKHICGGIIYNEWTIITAAHCLKGQIVANVSIRYNSLEKECGGTVLTAKNLVIHNNFGVETYLNNDIGLIHLNEAMELGQNMSQSIALPSDEEYDPIEGTNVTAFIWGHITPQTRYSQNLVQVEMHIISRSICQSSYNNYVITDNMICAGESVGGKDACEGDSGGPLVDNYEKLIGIVSFGKGCRPQYPGIYTKISNYIHWINNNVINEEKTMDKKPEEKTMAEKPEMKPVAKKPEIKPVAKKPEIKPMAKKPGNSLVPLYRYYNLGNGDHFYTTNFAELGGGRSGYVSEGNACYVYQSPKEGTLPLYRYYKSKNGDHFYTTNFAELGRGRGGYVFEGIACYVYPSRKHGTFPLYRYYNSGKGDHFYTTNFSELGRGRGGYVIEGIAAYVQNTKDVKD